MQWLAENEIPFSIIFTKIDKLGKNNLARNIADFKNSMLLEWESLPEIFITSSSKKSGLNKILKYDEKLNLKFNQ
jgi:GTP-binding protein